MVMKNNLELVQELLESRLNSLNEKLDINNKNILEVLGFIREQTTKTNGRVTLLELQLNEVIINESKHSINCPRIVDIKKLEDRITKFDEDNFIVRVLNRWPKQVIAIIIGGVIITMFIAGVGVWQGYKVVQDIKSELIVKQQIK